MASKHNPDTIKAFVESSRYLDKEGRAAIPKALLLVFLYLLRGYVAGIVSLTFANDRTRLLNLFYSNTDQFALVLVIGLPALLVLLASTFANDDEPNWANRLMGYAQPLLALSLILDALLIAWLFSQQHGSYSFVAAAIVMGWFCSVWYLVKSRHWRFYRRHIVQP